MPLSPSLDQTMQDLRSHPTARPGAVTYGTLIKAYGGFRDLGRVISLWSEMRSLDGIPPNAVTFGCMLDSCIRCNQVETALECFNQMKSQNLHKNTVLYTTIIKGKWWGSGFRFRFSLPFFGYVFCQLLRVSLVRLSILSSLVKLKDPDN